jgi:RNA polymerase sigma factor (sigma-70 family)
MHELVDLLAGMGAAIGLVHPVRVGIDGLRASTAGGHSPGNPETLPRALCCGTVAQAGVDVDVELVEAARSGDHGAFGALIGRHKSLAVRLCAQVVGNRDTLDDAVQEAVIQAWLSLDKLRKPERFGPWLAGIALHVSYRWLRYRADQVWSLEALTGGRVVPETVDTRPGPVELADVSRRVRRAIAQLPRGQRSAIALFYLGDLSHAEIAEVLGIHPGAVKTRLHKARRQLRRALVDLWCEEQMQTQIEYADVDVEDVRAVTQSDTPGERSVVLLAQRGSDRLLPIWVGRFEGDAIAIGLVHAQARRPLTHAFAAQLLTAVGGQVGEVRIERLVDETYYAQVVVKAQSVDKLVDARPSDAIALALETGAPIRVSREVMQQAGLTRDELAQKPPLAPTTRSARDQADTIRERVTQPRATWATSTLF